MARGKKKNNSAPRDALVRLKHDIDGRIFTPQRIPNTVCSNPWNSIVVTHLDKSLSDSSQPTVTQVYDIQGYLATQMGMTKGGLGGVEYRFIRAEVWNFGVSAAMTVDFYPLQSLDQLTQAMARTESQPGKNSWACCGYEWPRSHKNYTFNGDAASTGGAIVTKVWSSSGGSPLWIRFHLLWRHTSVTLPKILAIPVFPSSS